MHELEETCYIKTSLPLNMASIMYIHEIAETSEFLGITREGVLQPSLGRVIEDDEVVKIFLNAFKAKGAKERLSREAFV